MVSKFNHTLVHWHVPAAAGRFPFKTPKDVLRFVKIDKPDKPYENLNQSYWKGFEGKDAAEIDKTFEDLLFSEANRSPELSALLGVDVYAPWDCMSAYRHILITPDFALISLIQGVSRSTDGRVKIFIRDSSTSLHNYKLWPDTRVKALAAMAVWRAAECTYQFTETGHTYVVPWDSATWDGVVRDLRKEFVPLVEALAACV